MPVENLLLSVAILLFSAKIFGEIAERFGVASLVGELLAGIIVGPVLGLVFAGEFLTGFLTISVIFLLFMAGLEIKIEDIKKHAYSASALAFLGGFVSFLLGAAVGMIFFNDILVAFAIGTALISTSNGTLFLFLMKRGEFNTKLGKMLVAITIADDVVGILFLAIFVMFVKSGVLNLYNVFFLFLVSIGFYYFMSTAGSKIVNPFLDFVGKFIDENILFTVPVAVAFLLAYLTENIGISIAIGAFLGGAAIANSQYAEHVIGPKTKIVSGSFFLPVFYATTGTLIVLSDLNLALIISIILAAVLGKIIGIGFMSRFFGVHSYDRLFMGIMMIPRGNENIAVLQIILLLGAITLQIYTSILFAMIATVFLMPALLKIFHK